MKLYEAVEALAISESWLEEAGGELTPEVEALLEAAEGDLHDKIEQVALKVRSLEVEAEAIKSEADRLLSRAKSRSTGAASLKEYLRRQMEAAQTDKVVGKLCTVALQLNPPALQVPDDADLGELYEAGCLGIGVVPETFKVNKKVLLDAVKTFGESVLPKGWSVTRSSSLRIR